MTSADYDVPRPDALARFTAPRELIATFADAEACVRQAFAMIDDVELTLGRAFLSDGTDRRFNVYVDRNHVAWDNVTWTIDRMRRDAWRTIVARLELRRVLSIKRWEQMEKALDNDEVPPITAETVENFVLRWTAEAPKLIEEAIVEVFEWLRPGEGTERADYKMNQKNARLEIGERIVLTGMVERGWHGKGWRANHNRQQHLTALENVFRALDGAGTASPHYQSDMANAIEKAGADGRWATKYFEGRCFKNHNLHLRFVRPDLLREFNKRAGGARLRPAPESNNA